MKDILKDIDKAFESKVRLGVMSALMVNDSIDYNKMKSLLGVTDGNLASHIKYLEGKEYIIVEKVFIGKKPNTKYMITQKGRFAFQKHIRALEALINSSDNE